MPVAYTIIMKKYKLKKKKIIKNSESLSELKMLTKCIYEYINNITVAIHHFVYAYVCILKEDIVPAICFAVS